MTPTLATNRLTLRPLAASDAQALTKHLANWDVIKWLSAPPWPYTLEDAKWFIAQNDPEHWAIEIGAELSGVISFHPDLGYWLAKEHHGKGLMSEAVAAVLDWRFSQSDETIVSGHFLGNEASQAILRKFGFKDTHIETQLSRPLGEDVEIQRMELTNERWHNLRTKAQ